uniref:Tudor domain-containing protein n=1 Tax=Lutzomyia longipalpis TaxID=7200 RepID=A0A1B0CHR9_LUTLO
MTLFVTHVETATGGFFLRIYGQTDQDEAVKIETNIQEIVSNQRKTFRPDELQAGLRCLTRYEDGLYYRAKIVRIVDRDLVLVHFIDYGNSATVHFRELLSLHTKSQQAIYLMGTAPQAHEYLLARISGAWSQEDLTSIRNEICNDSHTYHVEDKIDRIPIIGLLYKNYDYSQYLIEKRLLGVFISVKNQKETLQAGKLVTSPPHTGTKPIPEKIENLANMRYLQTSGVAKKNLDMSIKAPPPASTNPFLPTGQSSPQTPKMTTNRLGKVPDMTSPTPSGSSVPMEKILRQLVLP